MLNVKISGRGCAAVAHWWPDWPLWLLLPVHWKGSWQWADSGHPNIGSLSIPGRVREAVPGTWLRSHIIQIPATTSVSVYSPGHPAFWGEGESKDINNFTSNFISNSATKKSTMFFGGSTIVQTLYYVTCNVKCIMSFILELNIPAPWC